jgi:hypothetical protein
LKILFTCKCLTNICDSKEEDEIQKILQKLNEPRKKKPFQGRSKSFLSAEAGTAAAIQAETARVAKLGINSLVPRDPEKYLFDLSDQIDDIDPCYKGKKLQPLRTFPVAPSRSDTLTDAETQIYPGDFFNFDGEVQPILERLIGSVLKEVWVFDISTFRVLSVNACYLINIHM